MKIPQPSARDRGDTACAARACIAVAYVVAYVIAGAITLACRGESEQRLEATGVNPRPIQLVRPRNGPLSTMARLGREMFFDSTLSLTGHTSCATCHDPSRAYASAMRIEAHSNTVANVPPRAVPSLRYADRTPPFHVGPDSGESDEALSVATTSKPPAAPHGGFFWDGRAPTLQTQAMFPLINPAEMGNVDSVALTRRIRAKYGPRLTKVLGAAATAPNDRLLAEATFAIARFEIEDSTFHPYDSKYDAYLEGRAALTRQEAHGLALFEDPKKGNCSACHVSAPGPDRRPPMFTDYEYEALGVPGDARRPDLGVCGPFRADLKRQSQYCGMFRTPTLRNVATRTALFHNGATHTLQSVLDFYVFRDVRPELVYPRDHDGTVLRFVGLPARYFSNVDTTDAPFNRKRGDSPALTQNEMTDVIEFLKTLTDGYGLGRK